jgi:hypothetical protein
MADREGLNVVNGGQTMGRACPPDDFRHDPEVRTSGKADPHADHPKRLDTQKGPDDWFTGDVYVDPVAAPAGSSTFAAPAVHFTPGAPTAWHTHPHGQTIFVIEGVGLCQREGGPVGTIYPATACISSRRKTIGTARLWVPETRVRPLTCCIAAGGSPA